jgi:hypothetical protein
MLNTPPVSWLSGLVIIAIVSGCGRTPSAANSPPPPTYSISGIIPGAGGVSIRVTGSDTRTVTTTARGDFIITGLPSGTYTISPTQVGFVFSPVEAHVTLSSTNVNALSFDRSVAEEGLGDQADRLDVLPDTPVSLDEVILPNGQTLSTYAASRGIRPPSGGVPAVYGPTNRLADALPPAVGPQQRKNDVIAQMIMSAHDFACGRNPIPCIKWNFPADPNGTVNNPRPAQQGLTYVYGGKNPTVRTKPTDGCPAMTFGVDCSGLISRVSESAGLAAPDGSYNQADPNKWTVPIPWQLKFKLVNDQSLQTGDIVAWIDQSRRHIGIAASTGYTDEVVVISSTGAPGQCEKNIGPKRGPRSLTISQLQLGTPTAILRLVTTLSGTWDMYIRCSSQSSDAATLRFTINNDQGGPFSAQGTGIDYDGSPLSFILAGSYEQNSNTLAATLSLTDGSRQDEFTKILIEDDTGYFPMLKVVDNGGCDVSARLVRITPSSTLVPMRYPEAPTKSLVPGGLISPPRPRT